MEDERKARLQGVANQLLQSGVAGQVFPGASACIAFRDESGPVFVEAASGKMGPELGSVQSLTVFDLASVTKPFVAMAALAASRDGQVDLDAEAQDYLGDVRGGPAAKATLRHLLRHTAGLAAWGGLYLDVPHALGSTAARRWMVSEASRRPEEEPTRGALYSDLGYIVAGALIAKMCAMPLEKVLAAKVTLPLGIANQVYFAGAVEPAQRVKHVASSAATERCEWRGKLVRGDVHDENCAAMGGIAGHAGLFGTAKGVATFGRAILDVLHDRGQLVPKAALVDALVATPGSTHRLGWDGKSPEGSSAGKRMSPSSFGHLGFTGTSIWCDPERDLCVVLLTNRVCPSRANQKIKAFRPAFHDAVVAAFDAG